MDAALSLARRTTTDLTWTLSGPDNERPTGTSARHPMYSLRILRAVK